MKRLSLSLNIMLLALLPAMFLASCKDDEKPTTARIHGLISIDNVAEWATWQDSGVVEVTIFPAFSLNPPAGWGDIPKGSLGPNAAFGRFAVGAPYNAQDPVILTYVPGQTEYHYSIEVEPGTYSALAVGFRHNGIADPSLKTATLGVYWNNPLQVSHGIVIAVPAGPSDITLFDYPAPTSLTVEAGDELELDFKADFGFVNQWYQ